MVLEACGFDQVHGYLREEAALSNFVGRGSTLSYSRVSSAKK